MAMSSPPPSKLLKMENDNPADKCTSIVHLPPEILVNILSYLELRTLLTIIRVVCKAWNEAIAGDLVWCSIRHLSLEWRKTPLPLRNLIEKCHNLTRLDIRAKDCWPKPLINACLFTAVSHCHKLKYLSIQHFLIHSECAITLKGCLASLPMLESLDFSYCKFVEEMGEALAEAVSEACHLQALYLVSLVCASKETLTQIIKKCPPLHTLDISHCNLLLDHNNLGPVLRTHSRTLSTLNLTGNTVFEMGLTAISDCCILSSLKVDCSDLMDQTLLRLRSLPLRELELHSGFSFTPEGLKQFFEEANLTNLESLNVHGCSMLGDDVLHTVATHCPALRTLRAGSCPRVTDAGLWSVVRHCPQLVILVLRGLKALRGEFLEESYRCLEGLKFVDLAYCDGIKDYLLRLFLELGAPRFRVEEVPHYTVPYCGSSIDSHRSYTELETVLQPHFRPVVLISKSMTRKLEEP